MTYALAALLIALIVADVYTTRRFMALGGKEGGGILGPGIVTREDGSVRYTRSVVIRMIAVTGLVALALIYRDGFYVSYLWIPGWSWFVPAILVHVDTVVGNVRYIASLKRRGER
jgi:hypothetical protein